ncbi:hypothetical protein Tco_0394693 [Tanacetum coccineum]
MKKSHVDQFIFQRRPPMHTEPTRHADSPSLDVEVPLTNSDTESDEEVLVINAGDQDEGQAGPNPESQPQSSHGVHARPNREHMDLEATDASSQQKPEQMDEEFTITAYPNVQENLKLPIKDQVILEEPASSTGTLSSLQNLDKDLSFTDQFFMEKPHEEESGKTNAKIEVQLMVSVPINQDTSSVPSVTTLVSQAVDEIVTDAVDWAMHAPLRARFRDLSTVDMKEILQQQMFEDNSYKDYEVHNDLYEALQKSLELDYSNQRLADQEEAQKKKRKKCAAPRTPFGSPPSSPPPPPPPTGASGAPGISGTSGSSQLLPPPPPPSTGASGSPQQASSEAPSLSKPMASTHQSMAWTTSDTRFESTNFTAAQKLTPTDSLMQDDSILDEQVQLSNDEESGNDHLPKTDSRQDWWKPLPEEKRPVTPEPAWTIPSSNCKIWHLTGGLIDRSFILTDMILRLVEKISEHICRFSVSSESKHTQDTKNDFKNLYPSNFEDLNLLLLQGHLDHLPGSDKRMLSTAVKLWTRNLVITQRIMRFNEIYKFSDGTLTRILKALDYRVKEFKVKRLNPGMNTRFWTQKDVTRSKEFIAAIERRLKTRRIFRNLECFVGGRIRDIDYRLLQRTE